MDEEGDVVKLLDMFWDMVRGGAVEDVKAVVEAAPGLVPSLVGTSLLGDAVGSGEWGVVEVLLRAGFPWNALDNDGKTAGEVALAHGKEKMYRLLVEEGVRTELLMASMNRHEQVDKSLTREKIFLSKTLVFEENRLVDEDRDAVMMGWEEELMREHASVLCPSDGLSVLNIGFGLGIMDRELQKYKPARHVIIEAHPDVYAHMVHHGWDQKTGVKILFGRWQDVVQSSGSFDAVFFDTFGEFYEDLREFHKIVPILLKPSGIYSFFNGLAGTNRFFHDVYCEIAAIDLEELGIDTVFRSVAVNGLNNAEQWKGIRRQYFTLDTYRLPICRLRSS
uniref:Protein arginine N-methyltransferase 2 n=1 Tax=Compsopogon caeruleus TaxID=31354 RepID=A0A7S1XDF6_9RHOD